MSYTTTPEIWFGATVPRDSAIGDLLKKYTEHGGPTPTEEPGVEVDETGSSPLGDVHFAVRIVGTSLRFGSGPQAVEQHAERLAGAIARGAPVLRFFARIGVTGAAVPRIGWHFGLSTI